MILKKMLLNFTVHVKMIYFLSAITVGFEDFLLKLENIYCNQHKMHIFFVTYIVCHFKIAEEKFDRFVSSHGLFH